MSQIRKEHTWDLLQEPARPARLSATYLLLLAALDQGWRIEGPVQESIHSNPSEMHFFYFILRRQSNRNTKTLMLPENSHVRQFIQDEALQVVSTEQQ
jgi:hypothetical protein